MARPLGTVLITGASTGIGATYADRFARRGHPLVLVARDATRLRDVAARLTAEAAVQVDVLVADLTRADGLAQVEDRLRRDERIGILVNNAGMASPGGFTGADVDAVEAMIRLNVLAVTRLAAAALPGFIARNDGSIINIGSVVGLVPERPMGAYGATKAYVLHLSQALRSELRDKAVYIQAVLPAATRTEIWERSGRDVNVLANVMDVGELVDAALVGFDRREAVTIPSLPDERQWEALEAARTAMMPNLAQQHPAARYR